MGRPRTRIYADCPQCGTEYWYLPGRPRPYCSLECRKKATDAVLTKVCPGCNQTFTCYRSNETEYCTHMCRKASLAAEITTNCPTCGKEFKYFRSWPRVYCSRACYGIGKTGRFTSETPAWKMATCQQCGKEYKATRYTRGRFCSLTCWGAWKSANICGENHPKTGKRQPWTLPRVTADCVICGKTFYTKQSHITRRKCCSRKCSGVQMIPRVSGENNSNWKGGRDIHYYGPSWREAMRQARARDGVCQRCGITPEANGRELDVHHIRAFRKFGVRRHNEANALHNLRCYCVACHKWQEYRDNPA